MAERVYRDTDGRECDKGQQTAGAGNSVCPPIARALVSANLGQREWGEAAE